MTFPGKTKRLPSPVSTNDIGELVRKSVSLSARLDEEREYLIQRAPNAIEWITKKEYCDKPSLYAHWGAYSLVKNFFELRCPVCNSEEDVPSNPWGLSRLQLESEVLLTWSDKDQDDVCPKCKTTRSEFVDDELFNNFRVLHGIVGQRCLRLDSCVFTDAGMLTLTELLRGSTEKDKEVDHNLLVASETGNSICVGATFAGLKSSVKVKTEFGFFQESGEEHPIRILNGKTLEREWIKSKDLKVGDYLLVRVGAELFGKHKISEEAARFLGYIISDGAIQDEKWVKFLAKEVEVIQDYADCIASAFPTLGYKNELTYQYNEERDMWMLDRGCLEFREALTALGLKHWNAHTKEVPLAVRQGSKEAIVNFLKGYFTGDGWAYLSSSGGGGHMQPSVGCGSVHKTLSDQVRLLLLNLGIVTTLSEEKVKNYNSSVPNGNTFYRVEIVASYVQRFSELIGFTSPEKMRTLEGCIDFLNSTKRISDGVVDAGLWLRTYVDRIRLASGCTKDASGKVRGYNARLGLSVAAWGNVKACWSRDTKSLPVITAKIVLEASRKIAKNSAPDQLKLLEDFCADSWLPLKIISLEAGETEMADLRVPGEQCYVANGILNHNSGKSSTLAFVGTYIEHVLLTIAHSYEGGLYGYLGIPTGDLLHITYVASNQEQAKETIWAKYRGYRTSAPWFRRYTPWIKLQEKLQDTPKGMQKWEYSEAGSAIQNDAIGLHIDSRNSNSDGLAGKTRLFAAIDEICRMEQTEGDRGAKEIYRTMDASCQGVREAADQYGLVPWLGLVGSISSPKSVDDYGMQLLEVSKHDSKMFTVHKPTWEFNPKLPFSAFEDMLKKDYVGTMRNFGAQPPGAANPLILRASDFKASAIDPNLRATATFTQYDFEDSQGRLYTGVRLDKADTIIGGAPRVIAADAGANFDAFAVACAHGEQDSNGNTVTVFDWIIRLLTKRQDQEVYFESIYQVLEETQKYMSIRTIEFDHWQSKSIIQRLRNNLNLWAEEVAMPNEAYISFMRDAYSGNVRMLPELPDDLTAEPQYKSAQGTAIYELLKLDRDPRTDKIYNPKKGQVKGQNSDDVARVIVHAHQLVQDAGYTERQDDNSTRAKRKRSEASVSSYVAEGRGQIFRPTVSAGPIIRRQTSRGW